MSEETPVFPKVQYLAWLDLLAFFIVIGPTSLIFFASSGVQPEARLNTVQDLNGTRTNILVPFMLYRAAERNMTPTEYRIVQRVRVGCGRLYLRTFVDKWDNGSSVAWMSALLSIAMIIPLFSAVFFLIFVPGTSIWAKCVPPLHLITQVTSVSLMTMGNYILVTVPLCLLNFVWQKFPIQTILPLMCSCIAMTYKAYEIHVIVLYCREHFSQIFFFKEDYEDLELSPSEEFDIVMQRLNESDRQEGASSGRKIAEAMKRGGGIKGYLERLREKGGGSEDDEGASDAQLFDNAMKKED